MFLPLMSTPVGHGWSGLGRLASNPGRRGVRCAGMDSGVGLPNYDEEVWQDRSLSGEKIQTPVAVLNRMVEERDRD